MAFRLLRKIKYALFIFFVIGLVTVFYLTSVGLPKAIVRKIEPHLQFRGMVLNLDKIRLSVFEGIVATSVKYYKMGDVGEPIIQADKFVLKFAPLTWMRGGNGISGAFIKNGRVQISPAGAAAGKFVFDNIFADVRFEQRSRLKILSFSTIFSSVKLSGKGTIILPSKKSIALDSSSGSSTNLSEIGASESDLKSISLFLKDFASSNAVNVNVDFFVDLDDIQKMSVKADVHGRNTSYANVVIGGLNANIAVSGKSVKGNIQAMDAEVEGLHLQSANGLVQYDGKKFVTVSLKSTVGGHETKPGPVTLQLKYDVATGKFEGHAATECDLRAFVPLLRNFKLTTLADIFAAFDFKRSLPSGNVCVKGALKPDFSCRLYGDVLTDTLAYKNVSCLLIKVGFDAELYGSGEKVTIRPLLIVRDEGLARGHLIYDSVDNSISFSAMSMADPKAVATIIAPVVVSALKPFSFNGLCYVNAFGKVGLTNSEPNEAEISLNAVDARWKMLRFAPCLLTVQMDKNSYLFNDFNGSIYHGVVKGLGSLDPAANSSNTVYTLSAKADNVDFGVLINSLSGKQFKSAYEGTVSGVINLQGLLEDDSLLSMKGNGWIKIVHGRIFTVPIFNGLFDILGNVIPGLGKFNSKNNAQAKVTVENGKVHGRNVYIDGDVFSLKGSGDVYFDGRLDFKAQITFMRRHSLVGNLVHIITLPITKALQLHLGGTIADPKWKLSYLPW